MSQKSMSKTFRNLSNKTGPTSTQDCAKADRKQPKIGQRQHRLFPARRIAHQARSVMAP